MAQFKRTDGYALINAVMAQLTGQDSYQVIDAQGFMDAGKLAMTYSTDEIFNALTIVGARLFTATRPYKAPLWLIDSINSGYYNNRLRKISYYSTWALPSGAFNTNLYTNFADGFDNGENPNGGGTAQSTKDMYEQHPVHPLEMNFMNSTVWQDCITRYEDQIKIAFTSEDEWARFWSGVLTEKGNDVEQRKEAHNRLTLLNRMAIAGAIGDDNSAVKAVKTVIDLTAAYNAKFGTSYSGTQLRTTYLKSFLEFFVSEFKIISNMMTKRSLAFHIAPPLTLGDGDHYILRHTPKSEQRFLMYAPLWEQAKAMVMPEIFNTSYLNMEDQFEAVDFWQSFSMNDADKAAVNLEVTIPGWLENLIGNTTGSSDTKYVFNPDYVLGCLYDKDAVLTDFQFEAARTTPLEARKNYINTWMDFGLGAIGDPTENFVIFVMSEYAGQKQERFTGDGTEDDFVLTGTVTTIKSVTVDGTATTAYTYTSGTKTITFTTAPAAGASIVVTYV